MANLDAAAQIPVPGTAETRVDHRKKTISNAYLHRLQRRYFLSFDVLPIIGTAGACAFLAVHPFGVTELAWPPPGDADRLAEPSARRESAPA